MQRSLVFLAVLLTAIALCAIPAQAQPARGATAPAFTLTDVYGNTVNTADLLANDPGVFILLFFSLDSGQELATKLRDIDGQYGRVVAIGLNAEADEFKRFAEAFSIGYKLIRKPPELEGYDPIRALPVTYFIAGDATILNVLHGGGEGQANVISKVAQVYLQKARTDSQEAEKAKTVAKKAIESGEDPTSNRKTIAYAELAQGKLDAAEAEFGAIDAKEGLAAVALERGELDKAVQIADEAGAENGYAQTVKGKALMRSGKLDEAAQAYDAAVEADSEDWQKAEAHTGRGRIRQEAGSADEALNDYEQAVALDAYNVTALSNQSDALRSTGDLDKAAEVLARAEKRGATDALTSMMLRQIQEDIEQMQNTQRRELIRKQIEDLAARYREQKADGTAEPVDPWTSRPLVVAFLPGAGASNVFFERAGLDVAVRRELAAQLNQHERIQVVDREMLDELLQELNLGSSELADADTQLRLGKVLSAQVLGFVEFAQTSGSTDMLVRLVDTETTAIEAQEVRPIKNVNALGGTVTTTVTELATTLVRERPLQGLIADASSTDEILINLGANHGVVEGLQFTVFENGGTVEVGGRTLQRNMKPVGTLIVTSVEDEVSICKLSAGTLKEGVTLQKDMKVKEATQDATA